MWELPGSFHHQINLSGDKKRVLALSTETNLRGKIRERDDIFVILDVETGKIIHRKLARELLIENRLIPLSWGDSKFIKDMKADVETSHFNSIYEIPENKGELKAGYLKHGNIIINSLSLGIFILSPDLTKTLFHELNPFSRRNHLHDVQVSPTGEFLIYNNIVNDNSEGYPYSAIQKYDSINKTLTFEYTPSPKAFFFSSACGGVQELDNDLIFFSHFTIGGFLYSRKQKKMIFAMAVTNGSIYSISGTQQLKLIDFSKFEEASR
jgi:hypothetical protein